MITQEEKNNAALIHLSGLAKYVFPFAGIIVPLLIWQSKRHQSTFIDKHGKQAVNFNISMMVYSFIIALTVEDFPVPREPYNKRLLAGYPLKNCFVLSIIVSF